MLIDILFGTAAIVCCGFWFRAISTDLNEERYWWATFSLLPPLGVLRGLYLDLS